MLYLTLSRAASTFTHYDKVPPEVLDADRSTHMSDSCVSDLSGRKHGRNDSPAVSCCPEADYGRKSSKSNHE